MMFTKYTKWDAAIVLIFLMDLSPVAFSEPAPPSKEGPSVYYAQNGYGLEDRRFSATPSGLRSRVATTTVRLAYPFNVGPILILPLLVGIEDTRQLSVSDTEVKKVLPTHTRVISPGVVFITDTAVSGFRGFVKLAQYQAMRSPEPAGNMKEVVGGLAWVEPGSPKDSPLTAKLAVRHREYPHGKRTLLVAGVEKWFSEINAGLDIQYPSHALAKYNIPGVGFAMAGLESDGIQMPMRFDEQSAWAEGYHGRAIGSWTSQLWNSLHAEFKGGVDRQFIRIFDHNGTTVEEIRVGSSLFLSVALETLF